MGNFKVILTLAFFLALPAQAAQRALILSEEAPVFENPETSEEPLSSFHKGTTVHVSSQFLQGADGQRWFKVFIDSGKYGYIRVEEVRTETQAKEMASIGVHSVSEMGHDDGGVWTFALRVMGLGGATLNPQVPVYGGDAELSSCLFFWSRTRLRQVLSLAAVFQLVGGDQLVGGGLIARIPTMVRAVPELRLRSGYGLVSALVWGEVVAGVQYPFSLNPGFHVSGYMEAGAWLALSRAAPSWAWAAAGLGLHF